MDCSTPDLPASHYLLKFAQVHVDGISDPSISFSDALFSFCPQSFPASGTFQWVSCSHQIAKIPGFPGGSAGKESACSVGDLGSIPGLERSPGKWNSYPLQSSGLENSMECIVHGVAKGRTWLNDFHFHISFSVSPSNKYWGLIFLKTDWFDLLGVQGTLSSLL